MISKPMKLLQVLKLKMISKKTILKMISKRMVMTITYKYLPYLGVD